MAQEKKIENVKFSPEYIGRYKNSLDTYILVGDNGEVYLWKTDIKVMEVEKPFRFLMITEPSKITPSCWDIDKVISYSYLGRKRGRPCKSK